MNNTETKDNSSFGCLPIVAVLIGILLVLGGCTCCHNISNHRVMSGFAGYVYTKPITGQSEFQEVLIGPASTGLTWRRACSKVSITPYTIMEKFDADNGAILGADKLPITCNVSLVFRIDSTKVKEFMEEYGGIARTMGKDEDEIADEIMTFAYDNFVKQPFRTAVRAEISKYEALNASSNLPAISDNILKEINTRLNGTPFIADSVAVGETNPPQQLIDSVVKKVQATQENERKEIELEIARKNIEIEKAAGEAEGAKKLEIARQEAAANIARGEAEAQVRERQGQAAARVIELEGQAHAAAALAAAEAESKGLRMKEESIGQYTLQWKQYESMYNNAKLYIPSGDGLAPNFGILGLMNMDNGADQSNK